MLRVALAIEYDGAAFLGWQSQLCGGGVQDALQQALASLAGAPVKLHAAGRTDSGVHATLQIAHFDAAAERPPKVWVSGANARLPTAVRVLWAQPAAADFHARYAAVCRSYQYIIINRPSALMRNAAAYCRAPLSLAAMQDGMARLVGEHDFSGFRAASCRAKSPWRRLSVASARQCGDLTVLYFCGSGFLHHMIRNMAGALLEVGQGRKPPHWIEHLLHSRDRCLGAATAAAGGLYFTGAEYPGRFELPEYYRPPPLLAPAYVGAPPDNDYL